MDEFALIRKYFAARLGQGNSPVTLGPGDDAALLMPDSEQALVMSVDTQVESRHFPEGSPGDWVASRSFGAAVSDLAAMGASPLGYLLALTLPVMEERWLSDFSGTLHQLAEAWQMTLLGGDTTRGPLTVSFTVIGQVPCGQALHRRGAMPGDQIWVSGYPGEAAAGLQFAVSGMELSHQQHRILKRYLCPSPRLALGQWLRGKASAAIDVSDGLAADLGHICAASGVAACLIEDALPVSEDLLRVVGREQGLKLLLHGGDDYEICFTAPRAHFSELVAFKQDGLSLHCIGEIQDGAGLTLRTRDGIVDLGATGYNHFAERKDG